MDRGSRKSELWTCHLSSRATLCKPMLVVPESPASLIPTRRVGESLTGDRHRIHEAALGNGEHRHPLLITTARRGGVLPPTTRRGVGARSTLSVIALRGLQLESRERMFEPNPEAVPLRTIEASITIASRPWIRCWTNVQFTGREARFYSVKARQPGRAPSSGLRWGGEI
jgi:hypothetical protein